MKPHYVKTILSKPKQMEFQLDSVTIIYWGVDVELECEGNITQSTITFDKITKARKLKLGDVFER